MTTAQIALPEKLIPVFEGEADVRGAKGGRGSAKTRSFAKMCAVKGYIYGMAGIKGILLCARQFMNSLSDSSLEECKRAIEEEAWLAAYYEIGDNYIKSRDGRIAFVFAGLDRNIASIKSKGRILVCWVDEAEPVTEEAWTTLIPTLREEGEGWNAELWVTWNPKRKTAPVEKRFPIDSSDPRIKIVVLNWRDNPKFPAKLERDRQRDKEERPEQYDHIWEGGYSLDSLNSTGYTLDTLPFSLDSRVWTGGQVLMAAFTPSHQLAYFTGSPANATADTVELEPFGSKGKRAFLTSTRPLIDGASPTVQIGTRNRLVDSPAFTTASSINAIGECPTRADGRYMRARIQTTGSFTNLQGVEIPEDSIHMTGRR